MTAVAPSTRALSPYVGLLRAEVEAGLRDLLGGLDDQELRLSLQGEDLVVDCAELHLRLGGVGPEARKRGEALRIDPQRSTPAWRAGLRARLAQPERAVRMAALARALDAWWPYARLPDEEFRKISSSPHGAYGTLRLGYRCNQDCWFCWQDRRAPSPPLEQMVTWLDELAALGVQSINFTGGEATTWSALPELVARVARHHGRVATLQTNAVKLARPEYTRTLVEAGLHGVMVSLHAARADVSDRMTRAPGTFERTVAGIEQALDQGLVVTLTCVVEEANHALLDEHAAFVVERFARRAPDNPVARVTYAHPTAYHEPGSWQDHQVPFDQVRPQLSAAVARLRAAGVPVQVGGPCGFPVCALDPAVVGDPYQVLERTVFSPEELVHRRFGPDCASCLHQPRCFGLRQEYLDRFGARGLVPTRSDEAPGRTEA